MGLKESGLRGSLRSTSSVLPAFFDVTITNTNSPVQEGDILTVDYSADNTGDAQDTQDIRLEIDSVQEDVDPGVMLGGGASATGTLEWDTTGEAEAEYTATVLSDDDSDSVTVQIESAIPDSADYYVPFSEGTGTTASPEVGSLDINLNNGGAWENNEDYDGGTAPTFGGSDTWITDGVGSFNTSEFSVGLWVKIDAADGASPIVQPHTDDGVPSNGWQIESESEGSFRFRLRDDGDSGQVNISYSTSEWYFVALAIDGGQAEAYVFDDNSLVSSESISGSRGSIGSDSNLSGAGRTDIDRYIEGVQDSLFTANSKLTQSELEEWRDVAPRS